VETSLSDPDVRVGVFFTHLCPQEFSSCRQSPTCEVIRMLFILLDVALVGFTTNLSWVVSVMLVIWRSYALCPASFLLNCSSWKNIVKTFVSCSIINCFHLYKKIQPQASDLYSGGLPKLSFLNEHVFLIAILSSMPSSPRLHSAETNFWDQWGSLAFSTPRDAACLSQGKEMQFNIHYKKQMWLGYLITLN